MVISLRASSDRALPVGVIAHASSATPKNEKLVVPLQAITFAAINRICRVNRAHLVIVSPYSCLDHSCQGFICINSLPDN